MNYCKQIAFIVFVSLGNFIQAQDLFQYDPNYPPNTFQSSQNPYYWKNDIPKAGYWQQDVHYNIKADINSDENTIEAQMVLTYWNNSPDTLKKVYFHLYQNAFQPDSYYDQYMNSLGDEQHYGSYESQKLGTVIKEMIQIQDHDEYSVEIEHDNTIVKIILQQPIPPNSSTTFAMDFTSYFDNSTVDRRMHWFSSYGEKVFKSVLWYPRIAVYDKKFGWHIDQHLGREFYGDFGTFDVELTFANDYIVEGTGQLQNENKVLSKELLAKLDINNFSKKRWGSKPSTIIEKDSTIRKTWKYHAENVHDFAFVASPIFRIGDAEWNGVLCRSLVQEPHAAKWQNAAEYSAKCIAIMSQDFGRYAWPKIIVADARDGMEYPMITLDAGADPDYRGLLAHEIGHMWFYGMVGNNETYRALLDEGFTQFLTVWAEEKIDGKWMVTEPSVSRYEEKRTNAITWKDEEIYAWYLQEAGTETDPDLTTHSDRFHGYSYWHVYDKTATMLYNLQYLLGDETFLSAMQGYFKQWRFAHPYVEDMRQSFIDHSAVDLNWYFDQWLDSNNVIDYKVNRPKEIDVNQYELEFERIGSMEMPIDFQVIDNKGIQYDYLIPNKNFEKNTTANILPKWFGWNEINRTYTATVKLQNPIHSIQIDTSRRLADKYGHNNVWKKNTNVSFDHHIYNPPSRDAYEIKHRPDVWWNGFDGIKAGWHIKGSYLNQFNKFHFTGWYNTGVGQSDVNEEFSNDPFSFVFGYETTFKNRLDHSIHFNAKYLDGLKMGQLGYQYKMNRKWTFNTSIKTMHRDGNDGHYYLIYPELWSSDEWISDLDVSVQKKNRKSGYRIISTVLFEAPFLYGSNTLSKLQFEWKFYDRKGFLRPRIRTFVQIGVNGQLAPEKALYLSQANPEEMIDNKYNRSYGFISKEDVAYSNQLSHFNVGGGLNLRGYSGYMAVEDSATILYSSNSGVSSSIELDIGNMKGKKVELNTYLFTDIGFLATTDKDFDIALGSLRMDAGVGAAFTIHKFWVLDQIKPLTIRADFPFFLNRPPNSQPDYFSTNRWVVGINRIF